MGKHLTRSKKKGEGDAGMRIFHQDQWLEVVLWRGRAQGPETRLTGLTCPDKKKVMGRRELAVGGPQTSRWESQVWEDGEGGNLRGAETLYCQDERRRNTPKLIGEVFLAYGRYRD